MYLEQFISKTFNPTIPSFNLLWRSNVFGTLVKQLEQEEALVSISFGDLMYLELVQPLDRLWGSSASVSISFGDLMYLEHRRRLV